MSFLEREKNLPIRSCNYFDAAAPASCLKAEQLIEQREKFMIWTKFFNAGRRKTKIKKSTRKGCSFEWLIPC